MKNILILIVTVTAFSCKAQTVIIPLGSGEDFEKNPNYYLKDTNNEFDKFVGEWKYQNGSTELTIKLKKEEHYQASNDYNYVDLLVGEYRYVENGIEVANSITDFDNTSITGYEHKISGRNFKRHLPSYCTDNSEPQEIKIGLQLKDPNNDLIEGRIILRYVNTNGTEKLEVCIYDYTTLADDENARFAIPDGYYEFEKQ